MNPEKIIRGKRILIVEDERDVIDVLIDLLSVGKIDTASSFAEGKALLESNDYDVAILDIMGVKGFDLLRVANGRGIPALMLTAHALSEENLKRSAEEGAAYYAPKDEMNKIASFVADVLDSIQKKKSPWEKLVQRLGGFYDAKFGGTDWREKQLKYLIQKGGKYL
jgi:DNA-binding response OmpR family regulator